MTMTIAFKKVYVWSVQHWRWLVFASVALIAYLSGRKSSKHLWKQAELARNHYKKEVVAIEKAHKDKKKKLESANKSFKDDISKIKKQKDKDISDLEAKKEELLINLANDQESIDDALNDIGIDEV